MNSDEDALAVLTQRMADLGASKPGQWARSEIREGIPQQARYLALRCIWANALTRWRDNATLRRYPALAQLLDQGADEELLAAAVREVVFEAVGDVIGVIDEVSDADAPDDAPGWGLMETDSDGNATGRWVAGLHESLLEVDPRGIEATDFWRQPGR